MKITILLLGLLLTLFSCSKVQKTTSSKIKLFGSSVFSGGTLAARANNGLILYGVSNNGKSFSKKVDSDVLSLEFPNGVWSFYAVAWEHASPDSTTGLKGHVSCAKALGINLNGTEVNINMNLSNNNCDGAYHPHVESVSAEGGKKMFGQLNFHSCRSISMIDDYTDSVECDTGTNDNKGYATYIKFLVPEYKNFGSGVETSLTTGIKSDCIEIDSASANAGPATALSGYNIPRPGLNGFPLIAQIYFSRTACDDATGFTTIPLGNSTKAKIFSNPAVSLQTNDRYFLEVDPGQVCLPPRLSSTTFASGRGTQYLPYTICNKDQFNLIHTLYTDGTYNTKNASFDLLANINFENTEITPTGDGTNEYTGNFNGRNHRIENFVIKCKSLWPATNQLYVGMFRKIGAGSFSNLTINRGLIDCEQNGAFTYDNVGLLAGYSNASQFSNIKAFGHVSGVHYSGLITGFSSGSTFTDVHAMGDASGQDYVGGIAGIMSGTGGSVITRSSFAGEVRGKTNGTPQDSFVGGIAGDFNYSVAAHATEIVVKLKELSGSKYLGGMFGRSTYANISDSVVTGFIISNDYMDGSAHFVKLGGIVGSAQNGALTKVIALTSRKSNVNVLDETVGSIIGQAISPTPSCNSSSTRPGRNFANAPAGYNTANGGGVFTNCNADANILLPSNLSDMTEYTSDSSTNLATFNTEYPLWSWSASDNGSGKELPRLAWEAAKENEIPYLKRKCAGLHNTPAGSGSSTDPYTICNIGQFNAMTAGNYYKLQKDLYFGGTVLTPKTAGVFRLDGDRNSLIDFVINVPNATTGDYGVFSSLSSGSEIKNLNIVLGKISSVDNTFTSGSAAPYGDASGILAGRNFGTISNVNILRSSINYSNTNFSGGPASYYLAIGGLVGVNETGSYVSNVESDVSIGITHPNIGQGTSAGQLLIGGLVGNNQGLVEVARVHGSVYRSLGSTSLAASNLGASPTGCATLGDYQENTYDNYVYFCNTGNLWTQVYKISSYDFWGSIAGKNYGTLKEIEAENEIKLQDIGSNSSGTIGVLVGYNSGGIVRDISFSGRIQGSNYTNLTKLIYGSGTLERIYFTPSIDNGFTTSSLYANNASILDLFCSTSLGNANNCYQASGMTIAKSGSSLTFSGTPVSSLSSVTPWDLSESFFDIKTWIIENNKLELQRTGGSFEKIGVGF